MMAFATLTLVLTATPAQLQSAVDNHGVVTVSDAAGTLARVVLYVHGPDWASAGQESTQVATEGDWMVGSFPMPKGSTGQVRFRELAKEKEGRLQLTYEVEFTEDSPLRAAYVSLYLPVARWEGRKIELLPSEETHEFPADPNAQRFTTRAAALVCDLGDGNSLIINCPAGPFVQLEDMRRFGGKDYELRFHLANGQVIAGQKITLQFLLAKLPTAEARRLAEEVAPRRTVDTSKPFALADDNGEISLLLRRETLASIVASVHGPDWGWAGQADTDWATRYGTLTQRSLVGVLGIPNTGGKQVRLLETISADGDVLRLDYRFEFPQAVTLNGYQVSCNLPLERWIGATVECSGPDARAVTVPEKLGDPFLGSFTVNRVVVRKEGQPKLVLQANEPTPLLLQDNRNWGGNSLELRFNFLRDEAGQEVPAGTVVSREFRVSTNPPLQPVIDASAVWDAYDQSTWVPFTLPWDAAPVDLSWLNDKPAGKHGKVTVRDGHFVFADGTPARFWGTCFSAGANFPTHEQSEVIARRLAAFGVNIVRTHHADAYWAERNFFGKETEDTRHFDPDALDRFDYLIFCLKREGIYVYLDQLVNRKFTAADGVDAAEQLPVCGKPYSNFDPKLIELQKEFSRMLWQHVNPYTGLAYRDDPAIAMMEFANENDLFTQTVELEPYRTRLEKMYRQWAAERGVQVPDGPVDFRRRRDDVTAFFIDIQRDYYEEMGRYLREEVGVEVPMTGSNWSRNAALLEALSVCDYTDSHAYWHHPAKDGSVGNAPAMRAPSPLVDVLSFNRLFGKPFFVSEWHEPWPNEWRAEITLYLAAVAALQDWDGLTVYTYAHTSERMPSTNHLSGAFETFNDPAVFGLFPHAALIFRRGDVQPAREKWVVVVPEEQIASANSLSAWGVKALIGTPEAHQVAMALRQAPEGVDRVLRPNEQVFTAQDPVKSDTGQLFHTPAAGYCTIDSPRTQAAMGFLGEAGQLSLSGLTLFCKTDFATVAASSLTEEPLEASRRVLVTAVGRVENTGTRYDVTHRRLVNSGKAPILCEPVTGRVSLKTSVRGLKVYPLTPDGKRREALPARWDKGTVTFELGPAARSIYYELVAE
ncbi:MAG: hypothetical protein AB7W28_03105 [Armatimonadota bacterium]